MLPRTAIAGALALAMIGGLARGSAADTLHVLSTRGTLTTVDTATGSYVGAGTLLQPAGEILTGATGLGIDPTTGTVWALGFAADACTRDPARVHYADPDYGCGGLSQQVCEQAFEVANGEPVSCVWTGPGGCESCAAAYIDCVNTCAPPPPCEADPARPDFAGIGVAACAKHDGAPAACGAAYFVDALGPAPCYHDDVHCLGCDVAATLEGRCTRDCTPSTGCDDPTRWLYAGSARGPGCDRLGTNGAACAQAYVDLDGRAYACTLDPDGACSGFCTPGAEADGACANTCTTTPACAGNPSLTTSSAGCYSHGGDAEACAGAFQRDYDGDRACFPHPSGECRPCHQLYEAQGLCVDSCSPPVCRDDPARTVLVGDGPGGCYAYAGDEAGCAAAFYVGRCGEGSCAWDAGTATCRPCTATDPGCTNACGDLTAPLRQHRPSLLTVDLATGAATVAARVDGDVARVVPDGGGNLYATGSRMPECVDERLLFAIDPASGALERVSPIPVGAGTPLALHAHDGLVYSLARDTSGELWMDTLDPVTGATTRTPATSSSPFEDPVAMTWAESCGAFLVAGRYGSVALLDPATARADATVVHLWHEWDEGDWPVGIVLQGNGCPPLDTTTTTTTTTTTARSPSTTSSTLPTVLLRGHRLVLTDPGRPGRRRLDVRSRDAAIVLGQAGGADDPAVGGATLRVAATNGAFETTYVLDGRWRRVSKRGRPTAYRYEGDGPIRTITVREGRRLEVRGRGAGLGHVLADDPGAVRVVLRLGARRWCIEFGGTAVKRTARAFVRRDAPAPPACPQ